jgi:hypothetical protein
LPVVFTDRQQGLLESLQHSDSKARVRLLLSELLEHSLPV